MNHSTLRIRALVAVGVFAGFSFGAISARAENPPSAAPAAQAEPAKKPNQRPPEVQAIMDESAAQIAALGLEKNSLQVGQTLPAFELVDSTGAKVSSAGLLAKGPLVITFYRGGWCPYCNKALAALTAMLPEFQQHGATLVAITPETSDLAVKTGEKSSVAFPILTDVDNAYAKKLGIVFALPPKLDGLYTNRFKVDLRAKHQSQAAELPVPLTLVVARDGRVVWRFMDLDYTKRAEPAEIVAALKALPKP